MALDLGTRLVIMLPTLLFLVGFSFKSIVENKCLRKLMAKNYNGGLRWEIKADFFFLLAIDSLFLAIANGLIIIFHLQLIEAGIILIVSGSILALCLMTGIYAKSNVLAIGFLGIFSFLSAEFAFFWSYETHVKIYESTIDTFSLSVIGGAIGLLIGIGMIFLAFPDEPIETKERVKKKKPK